MCLCGCDKLPSDLVLLERNPENQDTSSQIRRLGRHAVIVQCDLSSKDQVGSIIQKITGSKDEDGLALVIDILVNCGGIQRRSILLNFLQLFWSILATERQRKISRMQTGMT
jgi:2-deoxy-D-gluconate 3-dehydrogenase